MATLIHEIWLDPNGLPACILAGPHGADARALLLGEGAKLVHTFEAGSHIEAMRYYSSYVGHEPYIPSYDWDRQPYPDDWRLAQTSEGKSS